VSQWKRTSKYSESWLEWRIAKASVCGEAVYTLFRMQSSLPTIIDNYTGPGALERAERQADDLERVAPSKTAPIVNGNANGDDRKYGDGKRHAGAALQAGLRRSEDAG
jgi:hypothetical protein